MKTTKEAVKKKSVKKFVIKKNKEKTQQSPTDEASPSESASLSSKFQSPTDNKSPTNTAEPSLNIMQVRRSPSKKQFTEPSDAISPTKCATATPKRRRQPRSVKLSSPTDPEPYPSPESRRSSPRNKKLAEDNVEPSPNTRQRRQQPDLDTLSSPARKRQATKKKNVLNQSESAPPSQSATTKSHSKSSKGDAGNSVVRQKKVNRKLDTSNTGPCLNVHLRDPNNSLADLQDEEEE
ncbi:peptidyl-prolyl isomerase cwc27-like [Papaver somniferum]|uniref:peptidyl-prolyl isomerase cwc27-like n=1 Tax=Papaver somniferum TaxID=3469 RepID=UPI000E6FD057|nr:peptidyl-prolyl isomerase cwc27-like [Papaver somniferum]